MITNEQFISKIIELTKEDKITWNYLDSNKIIYESLDLTPGIKGFLKEGFDKNSSFYAKINYNFIVFYKISDAKLSVLDSLIFKTVPSTFREIRTIELEENKNELIRLHNIIKSKFPNSEDIINDILNL